MKSTPRAGATCPAEPFSAARTAKRPPRVRIPDLLPLPEGGQAASEEDAAVPVGTAAAAVRVDPGRADRTGALREEPDPEGASLRVVSLKGWTHRILHPMRHKTPSSS